LGKSTTFNFANEMKLTGLFFYSVMLFIFALPVMQVILFCLAIGRDPTGLKLAIVNHEFNGTHRECLPMDGCNFVDLGCRYLQHLNNKTIVQVSLPIKY
jgi:hypothetical protein